MNGWESLTVDTKISILVALGVLDATLCEIKMSKLNKQYIIGKSLLYKIWQIE